MIDIPDETRTRLIDMGLGCLLGPDGQLTEAAWTEFDRCVRLAAATRMTLDQAGDLVIESFGRLKVQLEHDVAAHLLLPACHEN